MKGKGAELIYIPNTYYRGTNTLGTHCMYTTRQEILKIAHLSFRNYLHYFEIVSKYDICVPYQVAMSEETLSDRFSIYYLLFEI